MMIRATPSEIAASPHQRSRWNRSGTCVTSPSYDLSDNLSERSRSHDPGVDPEEVAGVAVGEGRAVRRAQLAEERVDPPPGRVLERVVGREQPASGRPHLARVPQPGGRERGPPPHAP